MNLQLGTTLPSLVGSPLAAFDWCTVAVCAATEDAKTAAQKAVVSASAGVAPWPPGLLGGMRILSSRQAGNGGTPAEGRTTAS